MNNVRPPLLRVYYARGIQYPNVSVCRRMCTVNPLFNYAPILALVAKCDCHSHVGALRHSMSTITVFSKWNTNLSIMHMFLL